MKIPELLRRKPQFGHPRRVEGQDAGDCARLHATAFAHPWDVDEFLALLRDKACIGSAVESRSELAGYILSRVAHDEAEILTLVVAPKLRGYGCGQNLLLDHIARLAALRVTSLFLEVDAENAAALALYRRSGFVDVGRRKAYYAKADGRRADALIMRRNVV